MEPSSSTSFLSGFDGSPNQVYNDVAALETVSEDQEAIGGPRLRTTGNNNIKYLKVCSNYLR